MPNRPPDPAKITAKRNAQIVNAAQPHHDKINARHATRLEGRA
jgi:hypothetical protein